MLHAGNKSHTAILIIFCAFLSVSILHCLAVQLVGSVLSIYRDAWHWIWHKTKQHHFLAAFLEIFSCVLKFSSDAEFVISPESTKFDRYTYVQSDWPFAKSPQHTYMFHFITEITVICMFVALLHFYFWLFLFFFCGNHVPPTLVFWQEDLTKEHMFDVCVCVCFSVEWTEAIKCTSTSMYTFVCVFNWELPKTVSQYSLMAAHFGRQKSLEQH